MRCVSRFLSDNQEVVGKLLTDDNTRHGCNITGSNCTMHCIDRNLVGQSPSSSADDLVSNPLACACTDVQRVQQPRTDGCKDSTDNHKRSSMTSFGDAATRDNDSQRHRDNQRKVSYTRHSRADVLNALEVVRKVIDYDKIRTCEKKRVD